MSDRIKSFSFSVQGKRLLHSDLMLLNNIGQLTSAKGLFNSMETKQQELSGLC